MMKKNLLLLIILTGCLAIPGSNFGETRYEFRNHEVILFRGVSIPQFNSVPISQIFIYAYCEWDNSWHQLTFQIDELDGNAGYFGSTYNNIVDNVDEFVFLAGEAGDYATSTSWIDDIDSRQYVRYQIEISNPDDLLIKKYAYIYRSSALAHEPGLPAYIKYVPASTGASDTVKAISYLEGHNTKGIPDSWRITDSTGVYGIDILDRQKARVSGKYRYSFITISYKMKEDDIIVDKLQYKRGPLRIIRDVSYKAKISGIEVTVGTFQYFYYPYHIVSLGANKKLDSDYGVSLIRQSFDLNDQATGMLFNNPQNFDKIIDGVKDTINPVIQPSPVMNWYMYSGAPGTIIMLNEFTPPSNATYQLYYHDSSIGGTADGTSETGDGKSYGDVGILFQGSKIVGSFSLPYMTYFLPPNQPRDVGSIIMSQAQNPLIRALDTQTYTQPVEVAISLPDTAAPEQSLINIPVFVTDVTGLSVLSCQLTIQFDHQVLEPLSVSIANAITQNWNSPIFKTNADTISVFLEGTTALQDSGVLLYLNYKVVGITSQQSVLKFIQAKFNRWNPLALPDDGLFTVLPPAQVMVSMPDTSGHANTQIAIPVLMDDVTWLNITSYQMELTYSRIVLDANSVSNKWTLSSGWSIQNLVDDPGYLKFEMTGATPLEGRGTLVYVNFDVTGSPGQSTTIFFKKMQFNDGIPTALTRNALFTVYKPTVEYVKVSIPDTTVPSCTLVHSPVVISQVMNVEIQSYNMILQFDDTVLNFKKVDVSGSLTSLWENPDVIYTPGKININAKGDIPLANSGPMIFIDYDVIGPDSSGTTIHFSEMTFNSGSLKAETDDGIVQIQGVIPVELASFTAISEGSQVTLRWDTITETNNFGFHIQRKSDSLPDWQTIGFVPGAGTTTVPQSYSFVDFHLNPGTWYYRLEQHDVNGHIDFSPIVEVTLLTPTRFVLHQNYPNPFNSLTTIVYELPSGEHNVNLIVYDLLGHPIRWLVREENQKSGVYQISWDGRDDTGNVVAAGVYFYRLRSGNQSFMKKLILIE